MDLNSTPEQLQIVDAVGGYAADMFPVARLHRKECSGAAVELQNLASLAGMGWFGLGIPEALGGVGYGWVEDAMLMRECGRRLVSPIVLAARVAAELAARSGEADLARMIMAGKLAVAPLRCNPGLALYPHATGKGVAGDAPGADLLLAWNANGAALFETKQADYLGPAVTIDRTLAPSHLALRSLAPVAWCPAVEQDLPAFARLLGAAMAVGIAEAARDHAVEYAKVRNQFGRPIGSFQAVQHRCAEMAVGAEISWAQCLIAALSLVDRLADARQQVVASVMLATHAAIANSRHDIQIHGGMGFSEECDAHLYLKRAHFLSQLVGQGEHDILAMTGGHGASKGTVVAHAS